MGRGAVPRPPQLSRHLRSLRAAASARGVRPLHPPRRRGPPPDGPDAHRRRALPDVELLSRQRTVRLRQGRRIRRAGHARDRRRRRYVVLDAADDERGAQGRATVGSPPERDADVLARHGRRRAGARSRRHGRHARAAHRSRLHRARPAGHAAARTPHEARGFARGAAVRVRTARRRPRRVSHVRGRPARARARCRTPRRRLTRAFARFLPRSGVRHGASRSRRIRSARRTHRARIRPSLGSSRSARCPALPARIVTEASVNRLGHSFGHGGRSHRGLARPMVHCAPHQGPARGGSSLARTTSARGTHTCLKPS
ncbi:hypothetical protein EMIT0158MI4_10479 [Burkholderia ambifaria]